jgi:hypothetical protein
MDAITLSFHDTELEHAYRARQFRAQYPLHIAYTIFLICMFGFGYTVPSFRPASATLGPGFVCVLCTRVYLHRASDERWATSVGTWFMASFDLAIWSASSWVFYAFEGQVQAYEDWA